MVLPLSSDLPFHDLAQSRPLYLLRGGHLPSDWPADLVALATAQGFSAKPAEVLISPQAVWVGIGDDPFAIGRLPLTLAEGDYHLADSGGHDLAQLALAWGMGAYRFTRYRKASRAPARLRCDCAQVAAQVSAIWMARDLINTPANDMGPAELAAAASALAAHHGAQITITSGAVLEQGFPLVHAVGRGATAARAPRLIELRWGNPADPAVTLVGKGVCFDTGGLDIKPSSNMILMKKDMGGAACILALAHMVMAAKLPLALRVLIPAVENAISAESFRPSDILPSRKGLTIEIGNTDAEGRLILADALALADEERPALLIDFATLTGAARVAMGPQLPPYFTRSDRLAASIDRLGPGCGDPLWRLPLWAGYESDLGSRVADLNNAPSGGFAGAITAALFLGRFVEHAAEWVHVDIYGWSPADRPGHPQGGDCQAALTLFHVLKARFGGAA